MIHVFISHGSELRSASEMDDDDSPARHEHRRRFRARVLAAIEARVARSPTMMVWGTRNLAPPDSDARPWPTGLSRCSVGVVLVDRDALHSERVRRDATALMWRRRLGSVDVLPVVLKSVQRAFEDSGLERAAGLVAARPLYSPFAKENFEAVEPLTDLIMGRLAEMRLSSRSTPERRWIEDLAHHISGVAPARLWRVADPLGFTPEQWATVGDPHTAIAEAFLTADIVQASTAVAQLAPLLDDERARRWTVRRTMPLWVDLDAAKTVVDVAALPYNRRILAVGTRALHLGEHVVERATCAAPEYPHSRLPDAAGEDPEDELAERYDQTLRRLLHLSVGDTRAQIQQSLTENPGVAFAIVRCEALAPDATIGLLRTLCWRFPGVVFVALAPPGSNALGRISPDRSYRRLTAAREREARRYVASTARLLEEEILVDSDE